ncbi:hypothetical protein F5X96DRAFT_454126 [Biscogniauxia mediterranea]|nr:hypothetical protein F5X96DRAFT_454126 [Biscogniauxia mediterranea]
MAYYAELFEPLTHDITKGEVLLPNSPSYEESLQRWSATCVKRACVVVKPTSAQEVSAAIQFATSASLPIAVLCGGHSTGGASSSEGGLVIDLSLMRDVDVDPAAQTAVIGGGCLTRHVDAAACAHGLAAVSATDHTVGYGGFVLGGGYSFLTPLRGLGCDSLLEVEVVLADGRVVRASADGEASDLFWALRGAGPQLGVCTRFTTRLHGQGDAWVGSLVFGLEKLPDVVAFANHVHEHHDGRQYLRFGCASGAAPTREPAIVCVVFFNGAQADAEAYFKPLLDAGPSANTAKMRPWDEVNGAAASPPGASRKIQGSANFVMPLDVKDVQATFDTFFAFAREKNLHEGSAVTWEVVPYDKVRELDGAATAFPARREMYQISTVFQWDDRAMDKEVREFNAALVGTLKSTGIGSGVQGYNNYDGIKLTPEEAYGENLERLREVKKKYDPTNVFSKWHPILAAAESSS